MYLSPEACEQAFEPSASAYGLSPMQVTRFRGLLGTADRSLVFTADVEGHSMGRRIIRDSISVISGDTISDLGDGTSDQAGAIFRIDRAAPGCECPGC